MAKTKANNKIVLESVNQFTVDQIKYLRRATVQTLYDVDIMLAQINVAPEDLEEAKNDLVVMHLISQWRFSLQVSVCAVKRDPKELFDPMMKSRRITEPERLEVFAVQGDKFKNINTGVLMQVLSISKDGLNATMKHIDTMMTPSPIPINTIRKMLAGRIWERVEDNG